MKKNQQFLRLSLLSLALLFFGACVYFTNPLIVDIWTTWQKYNERVSAQADYTKISTPLPREVIEDICSKFNIETNDARCRPNSIVYAPEFFEDIKTYFRTVPKQSANLGTVREKLGTYLVACSIVDNQGSYSCRYYLRGDDKYPIFIYFNKDGYYYRIIANTGGS